MRFSLPSAAHRVAVVKNRAAYRLAAPSVILLLVLIIAPTFMVLALSMTNYELGYPGWEFTGLDNFVRLARDEVFLRSVGTTVLYVAVVVPTAIGLALIAAIVIEGRSRFRALYRTAFFLPLTATMVAMATVWEFIFHPGIGFVSHVMGWMGMEAVNFFGSSDTAIYAVAVIGIWQQIAFNSILFFAGLTSIPQDLYQAAAIDGADRAFDRFRTVTWPMLGPTTLFASIMTTITALGTFDSIAAITQGGPDKSTQVILYTIYLEGFQYFKTGYAAAQTAVFLFAVAGLMLLKFWFADRRVHYS